MNAAIWTMIYYAHIVNGDYDRVEDEYIEPTVLAVDNNNSKNVLDFNQ